MLGGRLDQSPRIDARVEIGIWAWLKMRSWTMDALLITGGSRAVSAPVCVPSPGVPSLLLTPFQPRNGSSPSRRQGLIRKGARASPRIEHLVSPVGLTQQELSRLLRLCCPVKMARPCDRSFHFPGTLVVAPPKECALSGPFGGAVLASRGAGKAKPPPKF